MKDLKGFIALDERGRLGVIMSADEMSKKYYGFNIDIRANERVSTMYKLPWSSDKPHVIDSVSGLKAKARVSERAFTKKGIEL